MNKGPARKRYRRSWREQWSNVRQWLLEDQANKGLGGPPNNWRSSGYFTAETHGRSSKGPHYRWSRSASFCNDAFQIWISEKEEQDGKTIDEHWGFSCSAQMFRRMALWYLWRWAWGEWFGLRRWLYYWDLHRRCERFGEHIAEVAKAELERQWGQLVNEKQDTVK